MTPTPALTGASTEDRKHALVLYFDGDLTPEDIDRITLAVKSPEAIQSTA